MGEEIAQPDISYYAIPGGNNRTIKKSEDGLFHPRFCFTPFLEDFGYESIRYHE